MATVSKKLKGYIDKKGLQQVIIAVNANEREYPIPTGVKVESENWNPEKEVVQKGYERMTLNQMNLIISQCYQSVLNIVNELVKYGAIHTISVDYIKYRLNESNTSKPKEIVNISSPATGKILTAFEEFTNFKIASGKITDKTLKNYTTVKGQLTKFLLHTSTKYLFETLDYRFIKEFIEDYLQGELDHTNQTCNKSYKMVRSFFKYCIEKGLLTPNRDITSFTHSVIENDVVYLSEQEFEELSNFQTDNIYHQRAADLFILQCSIGVRVSDLFKLTKGSFANGMVSIRATKGKGIVKIPLSNRAMKIVEKYDYHLPNLSDQKYRLNIKKVAN